jgi:hypothetical protein
MMEDNESFQGGYTAAERADNASIEYQASATMAAFHADTKSQAKAIMGPIGSGKSVACCFEIFKKACEQAPASDGHRYSKWAITRQTYPVLLRSTVKTWLEWFPNTKMVYGSPINGELRELLPDGTTVHLDLEFFALDRPADINKLTSVEYTGAWVNEAREMDWDLLTELFTRSGRYPNKKLGFPTWNGIILDTNPPPDDSKFYHTFEVVKPRNWRLFRQPSALIMFQDKSGNWRYRDNPEAENVENLKERYWYWKKNIGIKDDDWIKNMVMGEYGSLYTGKPIYQGSWSQNIHVSREPLQIYKGLPIRLGWDFGVSFSACIAMQLGKNGQVRILREMIGKDKGLHQFIREDVKPILENEFANQDIVSHGDPSGISRAMADSTINCYQILIQAGIPTELATTNDFMHRRNAVIERLMQRIGQESGFIVDPSCQELIRGFNGGYQFKRVNVGGSTARYQDHADKNDSSHPHDALQYGILGLDKERKKAQKSTYKPQQRLTAKAW